MLVIALKARYAPQMTLIAMFTFSLPFSHQSSSVASLTLNDNLIANCLPVSS